MLRAGIVRMSLTSDLCKPSEFYGMYQYDSRRINSPIHSFIHSLLIDSRQTTRLKFGERAVSVAALQHGTGITGCQQNSS